MVEYSRKMDWQINNNVKIELVKRWIDVQKLKITSVKGIVEIKGELAFTGKQADGMETPAILNLMKNIDMALKGLPNVRDIKWQLDGWQKTGNRWSCTKTSIKEEKEQPE